MLQLANFCQEAIKYIFTFGKLQVFCHYSLDSFSLYSDSFMAKHTRWACKVPDQVCISVLKNKKNYSKSNHLAGLCHRCLDFIFLTRLQCLFLSLLKYSRKHTHCQCSYTAIAGTVKAKLMYTDSFGESPLDCTLLTVQVSS